MGAHARSRSRSWALNLLYGWEVAGSGGIVEHAEEALGRRRIARRYRPYVDRLLGVVAAHLSEIDGIIAETVSNWRLERLDVIDRNILRIGIAELGWIEDVPPKVAIHEAVKLATKYGGDESPRFVNGVLDAVYRGQETEA
ncbi:MAG: transcription antitermination factor NusB [Gemmatimonadota bacterium]|nr:transcription antitermination factor NusB [Gemmatimonadota bacterium]